MGRVAWLVVGCAAVAVLHAADEVPALVLDPGAHFGAVESITWTPDGGAVVSGSSDGTVRVWDAASGETRAVLRKADHAGVRCVAVSPDGRWLAVRGAGVRVYELPAMRLQRVLPAFGSYSFCYTPDGRFLAVGDQGSVVLWDTATWRPEARTTLEGAPAVWLACSPDGKQLAVGAGTLDTAELAVLSVPSLAVRFRRPCHLPQPGDVWGVQWTVDGRRIVLVCWRTKSRLLDATNGAELTVLGSRDLPLLLRRDGRIWDAEGPNPLQLFGPDGRTALGPPVGPWEIRKCWALSPSVSPHRL